MIPVALVLAFVVFLLSAHDAQAIVILPALVLIPLAKLVAVVVASFGLPLSSLGILIGKVTKNHRLAILLPVISIIVIALVSMVILRWQYPENPWF